MEKRKRIPQGDTEGGLGGILKGLGDLVEKLGELAETGQELSKTGEIHGPGKQVRGYTDLPSRSDWEMRARASSRLETSSRHQVRPGRGSGGSRTHGGCL